jgi:hypothetical protein
VSNISQVTSTSAFNSSTLAIEIAVPIGVFAALLSALIILILWRRKRLLSKDVNSIELDSHYEGSLRRIDQPNLKVDSHYDWAPYTPSVGLLIPYNMIKEEKELGKK